ncbi:MAG: DUF1593 domain-containing protein [Armatimonadota bacterium]|nr:DUF1593 domain-containing protein [Armatimonadota bacterium]
MPRIRLLVLTDISSLTPGVREPDDGQSMIRLMLYSNEFDLEGLVASSNMRHGQTTRPELIHQVIDAYAEVRPQLLRHDDRFPPASRLHDLVRAGQPVAGPQVPVFDSIGPGKDTEASEWIARAAARPDPRPLWIAIWGGTADLAQALWRISYSAGSAGVRAFCDKVRVHSIGDQDSTGAWIKENYPGLLVITRGRGIRGMYRGGDTTLVSSEWVETHVRNGHGALGALYPNYDGGDIWSGKLGPVRGVKEGDTPSFLSLVPNGLNDPDRPELGSWGGRFHGSGKRWEDAIDTDAGHPDDPDPRMSAVYRWRPAFQADFQARLDWCVADPDAANHPPVARLAGASSRRVRAGETVVLDASPSTDPAGRHLSFQWSLYPPLSENAHWVQITGAGTPMARLAIPPECAGETLHALVAVTNDGTPPLTRYARAELQVE